MTNSFHEQVQCVPSNSVQTGKHITTGKNMTEKKLKCSHVACGVKFSKHSELRRHVELVHEKRRPFVCYFCKHRYSQRKLLYEHIQSRHLTEKPLTCPVHCGNRTASRLRFLGHLKRIHPDGTDDIFYRLDTQLTLLISQT